MGHGNRSWSADEELVPTRKSLVDRLRDLEDQQSWQEFFDLYWKLLYCAAIKGGLSDREAEDVVQETILSVARGMGTFRYDPEVCSFKGWLMLLTRHRIIDHVRKRRIRPDRLIPLPADTSTDEMAPQVPDEGAEQAFERMWNDEWEKNLVGVALEKTKRVVSPKHYQIFYLHAVKNLTAREIADLLKVSQAQVYVVHHRISRLVQRETKILRRLGDAPAPARTTPPHSKAIFPTTK